MARTRSPVREALGRAGRRCRQASAAALLLLVACGCTREARPTLASPAPSISAPVATGGGPVYAVRDAGDWKLNEARNPSPTDPIQSRMPERTLDWYAEYERSLSGSTAGQTIGQSVRLSGHDAARATVQQELKGFTFSEQTTVRGWKATPGRGADGPSIVLLEVESNYTLVTLSYQLSADDLLTWSRSLERVSESEWVERGGTVDR